MSVPDTVLSKDICEFIPYHNPMTYLQVRNEAQKSEVTVHKVQRLADIIYQQPSSLSTDLLTTTLVIEQRWIQGMS